MPFSNVAKAIVEVILRTPYSRRVGHLAVPDVHTLRGELGKAASFGAPIRKIRMTKFSMAWRREETQVVRRAYYADFETLPYSSCQPPRTTSSINWR